MEATVPAVPADCDLPELSTATLARFALGTVYAEAPLTAREAVDRTVRNAVGLAVGAAEHPTVALARRVHEHIGAPPCVSLLGRSQQMGVFAGPLVNAMAIHVEDYDDTHLPTVVHPAAPIIPAALAAAELAGASGGDLLSGVLAGVEVALRVADGICPEHYDRGWHLTGTAGHLGASIAAGRILGLPVDQLVVALGLAATQAAGLQSVNGTQTKAFHPGKAAANGVEAALLARRGFTGPAEPIFGRRGFAATSSPKLDGAVIVGDLGSRWAIERNAMKPYACGVVSHAAIDAAKAIGRRVPVHDIAEVEVRIPGVVLAVMGIENPQNALESKFSVYHCVAVGLLDGDGSPRQFTDERTTAEDVVTLRRKITAVIDDAHVPKGAALLRVRTLDGRVSEERVVHATASAERPMTTEELEAKFRGLVEDRLGADGADRLLRACDQLRDAADVTPLIGASRP